MTISVYKNRFNTAKIFTVNALPKFPNLHNPYIFFMEACPFFPIVDHYIFIIIVNFGHVWQLVV